LLVEAGIFEYGLLISDTISCIDSLWENVGILCTIRSFSSVSPGISFQTSFSYYTMPEVVKRLVLRLSFPGP
jgi:hypothetical protein